MSAQTINLRPRKEDLTIEELRTREEFKSWSEERLNNFLHTIKSLSRIAYYQWAKKKNSNDDSSNPATNLNSTTVIELPSAVEMKQIPSITLNKPAKRKAA
jgi:hypothetical protein